MTEEMKNVDDAMENETYVSKVDIGFLWAEFMMDDILTIKQQQKGCGKMRNIAECGI